MTWLMVAVLLLLQVRQHVAHKRTFLFLEQLILKHSADSQCVNIKDIHEGVDFFFGQRGHALKFVDFLQVGREGGDRGAKGGEGE